MSVGEKLMLQGESCTANDLAFAALRAVPVPLIIVDAGGRVVAASEKAGELLNGLPAQGTPYDALPLPDNLRRGEMSRPRLLDIRDVPDVRAIRNEGGAIVGAIQVIERFDGRQLCAVMAHEIRNPLAGIQGFARLLERGLEDTDHRRGLVSKILCGVRTVDDTVSSMLEFCRSTPPRIEPADLAALVDSAAELSGCTPAVKVETDIDDDCRIVHCDRLQMQQVLINLLKNAADASPEGSAVTVTAKRSEENIRITISDSGCGMSSGDISRLFQPFFTTKQKGTGIGLALARKILQQHNGDIIIESAPGKGTSVIMTLPHRQEEI